LRREKSLQPADAPQFLDLLGDPRLQAAVQFRHFIGALPQFAKEPGILHRDYRLIGKVLKNGDLLVRERSHLLPVDNDEAENGVVLG
jgi:hypothetical protein